ncbi:DUF934 domain-containing protein [Desertibaculum subflavum]|uniref:DUF934 domain-containing protein n=1 Tax=Desertibaculum subflavum TaxID=2268458 RepID=UPI000E6676C6
MPLVRDGKAVADGWTTVADDAALPADAPVIVSFARWRAERAVLEQRNAPLGLGLKNTDAVEEVGPEIHRFGLVALNFPKFSDGRAYSQARLLRERYGFKGDLRATGQVLPDQLIHMLRAGFDSFDTADARVLQQWSKSVAAYHAFYQPIGRLRPTLDNLRREEARPAAAD